MDRGLQDKIGADGLRMNDMPQENGNHLTGHHERELHAFGCALSTSVTNRDLSVETVTNAGAVVVRS